MKPELPNTSSEGKIDVESIPEELLPFIPWYDTDGTFLNWNSPRNETDFELHTDACMSWLRGSSPKKNRASRNGNRRIMNNTAKITKKNNEKKNKLTKNLRSVQNNSSNDNAPSILTDAKMNLELVEEPITDTPLNTNMNVVCMSSISGKPLRIDEVCPTRCLVTTPTVTEDENETQKTNQSRNPLHSVQNNSLFDNPPCTLADTGINLEPAEELLTWTTWCDNLLATCMNLISSNTVTMDKVCRSHGMLSPPKVVKNKKQKKTKSGKTLRNVKNNSLDDNLPCSSTNTGTNVANSSEEMTSGMASHENMDAAHMNLINDNPSTMDGASIIVQTCCINTTPEVVINKIQEDAQPKQTSRNVEQNRDNDSDCVIVELKTSSSTKHIEEHNNQLKGGMTCPICLEPMCTQNVSSTTCGHVFCTECIKKAVKRLKRCPTCRKRLTKKQVHPLFI